MAKKPETHEAMDAEAFDLDGWIDDVVRPEVTVELYPREAEYLAKVTEIEAKVKAAEKVKPEDRGMEDASPEALLAQIEELKAQRSAEALKVRVRQVLDVELADVMDDFRHRDETDRDGYDEANAKVSDQTLWIVSAACVSPNFTPAQLDRLRKRDRSGESMVSQLVVAVAKLQAGLPVPS